MAQAAQAQAWAARGQSPPEEPKEAHPSGW